MTGEQPLPAGGWPTGRPVKRLTFSRANAIVAFVINEGA
jgi:hypothetical protein